MKKKNSPYHVHAQLVSTQELSISLGDELDSICGGSEDNSDFSLELHERVAMVDNVRNAVLTHGQPPDIIRHDSVWQLRDKQVWRICLLSVCD